MTGFAAFSVMKVAVVTCSDGAVVARRLDTAEVHGSTPCRDILGGFVFQWRSGSASPLHGEGLRFDTVLKQCLFQKRRRLSSSVVERLSCKQSAGQRKVHGSIPWWGNSGCCRSPH